ncbi:hypothetical protein [uncultured Marivita sp.]|uniref:hypothetical protein n=1 Tax=uncultured Marivita sp. TaxID=888080 RepID=UPI002626FDD5|nr:hypothetical protein [uncultured Marivita sp.]
MIARTDTPERFEIELAIPRFILWFVMLPVIPITLFGLAHLLGGEIVTGLVLLVGLNGAFLLGYVALSERTILTLDKQTNRATVHRESRFRARTDDYPLDALDSAELERSHTSAEERATAKVMLVFRNTRPATRIPLSGWGVSGDGPGKIADLINDWLRRNVPY